MLVPAAAIAAVYFVIPEPPKPDPERIATVPRWDASESTRDTLRIGTTLLTNVFGSPSTSSTFWDALYEADTGERLPMFVERAPGVANNAMKFLAGGELEITWRIREDAKWSDGEPLTANDFAFAMEASPDERVATLSLIDNRTIVYKWKDRLAAALESPFILPGHKLHKVFVEGGYDAIRELRRMEPTPSLGPYRVVSFEKNGGLVAEANEHFLGPAPSIKHIEVKYFEDREAVMAAFEAGEIDLTYPNSITPEQAEALAKKMPDSVHVRASALQIFMHPDLSNPNLAKMAVRRALLKAINRKGLARDVYGDAGTVSHTPLPGKLPLLARTIPYDPDGARAELARAGADGVTLKLSHGTSPVDRRIAERVAADLRAVGLTIETVEVDSTFKTYRDRAHGGLLIHIHRGDRTSDPRRYWNLPLVSGRYPDDYRHDAYTDDVHALVEREMRALYPERREDIRDVLFAAYAERLPHIPLVFATERILATPDLKNWDRGADKRFGLGMETWYFVGEAPAPAPAPAPPPESKPAEEKKDDERKDDEKGDKKGDK